MSKQPPLSGILRQHTRGFGFVKPAVGPFEELFIPKAHINGAVDGDEVEIELLPPTHKGKGPEGKVVAILSRGRTHLGAIITHFDRFGNAYAYAPLLGPAKPLSVELPQKNGIQRGDRVLLKVLNWGEGDKGPHTVIEKQIGTIEEASLDGVAASYEFELPQTFPKEVLASVKKWGKEVSKRELKGRTDLTKLPTVTIDPTTAKDFDDALSMKVERSGQMRLFVHIADVSSYVRPNSPLDIEASKRSNTTYFPGACIPMLPKELSEELCSLKPHVIRLTLTVEMLFDSEGNLVEHAIYRSYIQSSKRFTYEEAKEVLDGKKRSAHKNLLLQLTQLCNLLKSKRRLRGSIDFALSELVIDVDKNGEPTGVHTVEYDITHQLVEECMLKANEVVAKELSDRGLSLLFRVHEEPESSSMVEFAELARLLGFHMPPDKPSVDDIAKLFEAAKQTPHAHRLSVAFIRSMKLALYSKDNVGHFGLALEHYCHFTSPIRRYSDLVIHRLLFEKGASEEALKEIGKRCSEQERLSMRAENHVKRLKKLRLLKKWVEQNPKRTFEAVITQIKPVGLIFEMQELMLEGFIHISNLEDDYFDFNPHTNVLRGRSTGITHRLSGSIQVVAQHIDLILQEVEWSLLLARKERRAPPRKKRRG